MEGTCFRAGALTAGKANERKESSMNEKHLYISDGDTFTNDEGNLVTIRLDYDCDSPREWDPESKFYTWLRSYGSPDEAPNDVEDLFSEYDLDEEWEELSWHSNANPLVWFINKFNLLGLGVALPVSAYIHSGIVYRVGTPDQFCDGGWDSGYAGLIFMESDEIKKNYMVDEVTFEIRERTVALLTGQVEVYSTWAEGSCYGYEITGKDGSDLDSCWGFIGDDAYENGIVDYAGDLHDTEFASKDEFVDYYESLELEEERLKLEDELYGMTAAYDGFAA